MKYPQRIGMTVLLALATMAFAGTGTAAAEQSVFCKVNETPCASGNRYPKGTAVVLNSKGPITWTTYWEGSEVIQLSCQGAEFEGEMTTAGGSSETVGVTFNTQILSSCSCPFTWLRKAKMKFNWTSGTMNASAGSEELDYAFYCYGGLFGTFHCTFEGNFAEGITLTGGNPATLTFKEVPTQVTGNEVPCGTEGRLNVEFVVTTPKPLYVSSA